MKRAWLTSILLFSIFARAFHKTYSSLPSMLILGILLCMSLIGESQDTYVGDLNFAHQSEIDSFLIQHPTCTAIEGAITLNNINNDIFNVSGFSNIEYISEDLRLLFQAQYFDLSGFIALDSIGDSLIMKELDWIYTNQTPVNIFQGFSGVQSLGHFVFDNGYLYNETNLFPSLISCQSITFHLFNRPYLEYTNSFNNLSNVHSIAYKNMNSGIYGDYWYTYEIDPMGLYFSVDSSYNSVNPLNTLFFDACTGVISNSFITLNEAQNITIGQIESFQSRISASTNSFSHITSISNLVLNIELNDPLRFPPRRYEASI